MDPDYEVTESLKQQAKEREEKEKADQIDRIKLVIHREFKSELQLREKQLEEIQRRLSRASKTLHLLRYVLISSYYKRNELQYQQTEEEMDVTDGQSRIHPAVKNLIGENVNFSLDWQRRKSTRTSKNFDNFVVQESEDKTLKQSPEIKEPETVAVVQDISTATVTESDAEVPVRNRQMVKKRIVVGNISKWMPSESSGDNSTHKWMVYVRGPKASPNVDDFVQKVVFYLHPSYQPNDVIELRTSPFHLSRRGWGEFPLRVQIYFHSALNKPVDIIHNLKLDKTYSGRQTLGNETIVDITLYSNEVATKIEEAVSPVVETDNDESDGSLTTSATTKALFDHTYSLSKAAKQPEEDIGELTMLMSDGKLMYLRKRKRPPESLLKISCDKRMRVDDGTKDAMKINYEKSLFDFPKHLFKTTVEALPYLLKHLPLINPLADDLDYKCTYPFTARSLDEYASWPIEKRQSCEWSRAKRVQKLIQSSNLDTHNLWTVKKILAYARAHGYTELANYTILKNSTYEEEYLTNQTELNTLKTYIKLEKDMDVDVIKEDDEFKSEQSTLKLLEPRLFNATNFVKQAALDVGVLLKPEEIIPGVAYDASQRVLLQAAMSFAENLIRNARGVLAHKNFYSEENSVIGVEEINAVLNGHRPEFKQIINFDKELVKY